MGRPERSVTLSKALYPGDSVEQGIEHFRGFCVVKQCDRRDSIQVTISPFADAPEETIDEFLNFVLSVALDKHLS